MTTTRIPHATAMRPGLGDETRAVWAATFYEATEDGTGRKPDGQCWTTTVEAHPLTSNRTVGHQVWLHLNREPDIPEVDMLSAHIQLLGYAAGEPDEDGKPPRLHGARCTGCGSSQVVFTTRGRANCHSCGTGQMQGEAALCSQQCDECEAAGLPSE
ncbi:hypothetical protein [Streptomyces regalis]|uniref:Uncharacterized protein n=1 Tax=Streptomyces regalis TaxID=68262 RepID=A0A117ML02_9ACTN|nr:hypothetical protein [Streptomyces regalis]KUL23186.1 hypothetical protein ADL12_39595 [Streptomyces regalis]